MTQARSVFSRVKPAAIALIATCVLPGCGPAVMCKKPAEWPANWSGRRLYHTPHAYIYATSDTAAGEADRLAASVARDYRRQTGADGCKGLLIVTDAGEPPLMGDLRTLLEPSRKIDPIATTKATELEKLEELSKSLQKMAEQGLDLAALLRMVPLPLDREFLAALPDFPPQVATGLEWAAAVPTKGAIRQGLRSILLTALNQEDVSPAVKVLLMTILPMMEGTMVAQAAAKRDVVLFERLVATQAPWSPEEKKARIAAYRRGKTGEATDDPPPEPKSGKARQPAGVAP